MIFAAYFILKGRDPHINFLRLLFMVSMICPLSDARAFSLTSFEIKSKALQCC